MIAALASYGVRVTVLGLLLMLSLSNAERFARLDPVAVVVTTVTVVFGWLGAEICGFSRGCGSRSTTNPRLVPAIRVER